MSQSLSSKSIIPNNLLGFRCPECSLIPFIEIINNDNKLTMKTFCTNNHTFNEPFDKMQMMCKSVPKSKYFCSVCGKVKNDNPNQTDEIFYYCSICFKFYCYNHGKIHKLKDGHNIYFHDCFDNICFQHNGTSVIGFCREDNKNYCKRCECFGENKKNVDEELNVKQIEKYEKEIENNKKILKEIDDLFKNYKKTFNELENTYALYKQNMTKKINFMNELVNDYKDKLKESALNFQMKANIEINHFDLTGIKPIINSKISEQNEEIIAFIQLLKSKMKSKIIINFIIIFILMIGKNINDNKLNQIESKINFILKKKNI